MMWTITQPLHDCRLTITALLQNKRLLTREDASWRHLCALGYLALVMSCAVASTAMAEPFSATLAGHVVIPAETFVAAPADAPADLKTPGKFTTAKRVDQVASIEGTSNGRPTGVKLPFNDLPVQGHSDIKKMSDGSFWVVATANQIRT